MDERQKRNDRAREDGETGLGTNKSDDAQVARQRRVTRAHSLHAGGSLAGTRRAQHARVVQLARARTGGGGVAPAVETSAGMMAEAMAGMMSDRTTIWKSPPTHVPIQPLIHFGSPTFFAFR